MTVSEIIEGVLLNEGEGKPPYLVAGDKGGRTSWGISEKYHPREWFSGPPSKERARVVLTQEYAEPWAGILDPNLRAQLTDIAVLHGHGKCHDWLKEAGVDLEVGNNIVDAVNIAFNTLTWDAPHHRVLNNAVVASRLGWIDRATDQELGQKKFEEGWESRALRFLVRS